MSTRYLSFVLLVWSPVLGAQTKAQNCKPPALSGGYVFPGKEIYRHGESLTYACDKGLKPAVEGWWASSKCEHGKWIHEPQCIDEQDCILPTIPNGHTTKNSTLFKNGDSLRTKCNEGYDHKNDVATARCENGTWSSLPICQKDATACGQPPKVPHAVILQEEYKEVFPANTEVLYICEDGYAIEGRSSIFCIAGEWDKGPICSQPSSSSPGTTESEIQTPTTISNCDTHPTIEHGDIEMNNMFLKIRCKTFYRRVGPEKVVCYTDGTWSKLPVCKDTRCSVDTTLYPELVADGVKHLRDRDKVELKCVKKHWYWVSDHYSLAECFQGTVTRSDCRGFAERQVLNGLEFSLFE